jgi:hypothetical protein
MLLDHQLRGAPSRNLRPIARGTDSGVARPGANTYFPDMANLKISAIALALSTALGVSSLSTPVDEPPPPREERVVERPGYVWERGHYGWRHRRYVWTRGHYVRERRGYDWAPGRWERHEDHYDWRDGEWHPHR